MLVEVFAVAIGIATTWLAGWGVRCAQGAVKIEVPTPANLDVGKWKRAIFVQGDKGVDLLGRLERMLYFASFWLGAYIAIGGWLAFKLGSKWQIWQHIIKMPENLPIEDPLEKLHVQNQFGTWLLSKFLIGSLYNVLCGLGGAVVGRYCLQLLTR